MSTTETTLSARSTQHAVAPQAIAVGAAIVLLLDVIPVWLLSITTIYGQAGDTSVVQMLVFALVWFVLPGLAVLVRSRWLLLVAIGLAGLGRLLLQADVSPDVQVYASSVTVLMLLCWFVAAARTSEFDGRAVAFGFYAGVAASVTIRVALGGVPPMWTTPVVGWAITVALMAIACASTRLVLRQPSVTSYAPGRLWFALWPALVVVLLVTGAPLRATVAVESGHRAGQLLIVAACIGGAALTLLPQQTWVRSVAAATFLVLFGVALMARATVDGVHGVLPSWAVLPQAGAAATLGLLMGNMAAPSGPATARRRQLTAWGGQLVFFVVIFVFFASEAVALPFPAAAIPIAVAALLAVLSLRPGSASSPVSRTSSPRARTIGSWVAVAAVGVLICTPATTAASPPSPSAGHGFPVRLLSYNVHVGGVSLDGRYDPDRIADVIDREKPDVVWLSEMDRGWAVDGDHDALPSIARRLGMRYVYAPAAGPDWGDAVLSRFPIRVNEQRVLPAAGAPTGAQALSVTIDVGKGQRLGVVGTHLQTLDDNVTVPPEQSQAVADMATRVMRTGTPVVVTGDLNDKPGSVALRPLDRSLVDGLHAWRPVATFPADQPTDELDQIYLSPDLAVSNLFVGRTTASDHLPVTITLEHR
ncbi:endonuclease/exonuclease/phosphatase family protein [Luteipulveratus mongoliensis]|uniref:Endonuclease/exonuclease/phosphatase domain-containing protein n=1 Tax=Luteipulveratus mongoliensis TaxID=571913 RepID=A0A0K1JNF4_9MICO|nr:endonuclease/exonuclease/phosphatase family protein [Luteipulveratus mongoliensis]AKU18244.1 hypothetical protein VV02_24300 [Luteipulveratus mongoliensis]